MKCNNCGMNNADGARFCTSCGAPMNGQQVNIPYNNIQNQSSGTKIPYEYKPISMWGYFGYEILFLIPVVGFIMLLVFSFGGTTNINLKNFARSYFCGFIIFAVIVVIIIATAGGLAAIGSIIGNY